MESISQPFLDVITAKDEEIKKRSLPKKIYMLSGSGDGMLSCYGNAKQALKNAIEYVTQCEGHLRDKESTLYRELCERGFIIVESTETKYGISSAEILQVYLNYDLNL